MAAPLWKGREMKKKSFKCAVIWFLIFVIFTALVKFIDTADIGPEGSIVGFAKLNGIVRDLTNTSDLWYKITQICGYMGLLIAACFALAGVMQLIKGKSLYKVDYRIAAMGVYYVIVLAFYAAFMFVVINFRPVIMEGEGLESSYPSSHTMLALTVVYAFMIFCGYFKKSKYKLLLNVICYLFMAITVFGRILSGVHWFTDIIGGVLLSVAIINTYEPLCSAAEALWAKHKA